MRPQIPFTPLTPEALERLTLDEQMAFEAATCAVAGDQKPSLEVIATVVLTVQRLISEAPESTLSAPASEDTGRDLSAAPEQARDRTGADPREPLVMPQDEFGLVKWLQDALAEAIGPACGLAAVGRALEAVTPVVEHAARAAAGSHEGIRLWMLDCGSLVQKHREHAVEASALLGEQHARAEMAEERLAEIATLCRNPAAFVGQTMGAGRHVPGDRVAARILTIIGGGEAGRG